MSCCFIIMHVYEFDSKLIYKLQTYLFRVFFFPCMCAVDLPLTQIYILFFNFTMGSGYANC